MMLSTFLRKDLLVERFLESFKDVPRPDTVYDQYRDRYEYHSSSRFQSHLEGKEWWEVSERGANSIEIGILDNRSAQYYTQATLCNDYGYELPGAPPPISFIVPLRKIPFALTNWYRSYRRVYTKDQMISIAIYMWTWSSTGKADVCDAYNSMWRYLLLDHVYVRD